MKNHMTRIVGIILITIFICPLWATELENKPEPKIEKQGNNWFFSGFNFDGYGKETHGLKGLVEVETDTILAQQQGRYGIIGHSQGGLRVLAYATYLKDNYPEQYKNLKGVITVSGIDKGLKALEGGVGPLKSKLYTDADILWKGAKGIVAAVPFLDILIAELSFIEDVSALAGANLFMEFVLSMLPSNYTGYIEPALRTGNLDELAEIKDMVPRSDFIKEYVAEVVEEPARREIGTRTKLVLRSKKVWFFTVWYIAFVTEKIYQNYTIYHDVPKFDRSLPVGYFVGLNKDTLSMAGDKKSDIQDYLGLYTGLGAMAIPLHVAKCAVLWGLFTGSPVHIVNIGKGMDWTVNYQREIDELMGSPEHDGLVAKESQFYPKKYSDKILGNQNVGYDSYPEYNHMTIMNVTTEDYMRKLLNAII